MPDFLAILRYEPETGRLLWRAGKAGRGCFEGNEAGSVRSDGRYRTLMVDGRRLYAHRVIWEMVHGPIPADRCIDHINGVGTDNRIANLRLVTLSLNQRTRRRPKNNRTGVTGVHHHGDAFVAHCAGEYLGRFPTVDTAAIVRRSAEARHQYITRKD